MVNPVADLFFNGIGFAGLGLFLWAYAMINLGYWQASEWRTHLPNLVGAIFIVISLTHNWNLPVFLLECCWATISIYGLWKSRRAQPTP